MIYSAKTPCSFSRLRRYVAVVFTAVFCSLATNAQQKNGNNRLGLETITYRAQVWVEKDDLARYGGEKTFTENLVKMFEKTTYFWNESENKFKYYFEFIPAGLHVYDIEGDRNRYDEFQRQAYGPLDTAKYDFVVFFALNANSNGLWCGGGGKSRQAVVCCYQTLEQQEKYGDIFAKEPPEQGTYSNLGHEYGHVRGATDIYQYIIKAEDNPISHEALRPPKCNMGNGMWAWSDYCSNLFNFTAPYKQLPPDLNRQIFPEEIQIKVLANGKAQKNVTVKLYGTRAGGKKNHRDVYPHAYRTLQTDKKGIARLTDIYELYHPAKGSPGLPPSDEFPYAYWFCFLVEAEYNGEKKYVWIPDWATQITKMNGKNIHEETIEF